MGRSRFAKALKFTTANLLPSQHHGFEKRVETRCNDSISLQEMLSLFANSDLIRPIFSECEGMNQNHNAQLPPEILASLRRALDEDISSGDVTTDSIVSPGTTMRGQIIAKQSGVVAGLDVAGAVFTMLDPAVHFIAHVNEGAQVRKLQVLASVSGNASALLRAERTALNILGRMSGIATLTRQFVDAVVGTKTVILDTRKTAPGLRVIDKLSVLRGGGQNHRMGLYDMILIKDNHIDLAGSITEAVRRARQAGSDLDIEVEARTLDDVKEALDLDVKRLLLDNMPLEEIRQAVALSGGRAKLEASGNITLENVRQVAQTGVDYISVGALTHSAKSLDISFIHRRQDAPHSQNNTP
jgi:nicotinate-nucleotide pyrophosphorylase (carboxylating)